jgi:hypothetical protein
MSKFNVNGNIALSAYIENMEVINGDPEQTFKDKFVAALKKGGIGVDWIEPRQIDYEEIPDYTKKLTDALFNLGYGVRAIEMPICIGKGYTEIGGKDMGLVSLWKAKVSNAKELVFLLINGLIYLPCNPMNYFLIQDSTTIQNIDDIFKVYWMKDSDVYILNYKGRFCKIYSSRNNFSSKIGQRLAKVREKIQDSVYIVSSSPTELNLCSATEKNVAYDAYFNDSKAEEPYNITMTKRIL